MFFAGDFLKMQDMFAFVQGSAVVSSIALLSSASCPDLPLETQRFFLTGTWGKNEPALRMVQLSNVALPPG